MNHREDKKRSSIAQSNAAGLKLFFYSCELFRFILLTFYWHFSQRLHFFSLRLKYKESDEKAPPSTITHFDCEWNALSIETTCLRLHRICASFDKLKLYVQVLRFIFKIFITMVYRSNINLQYTLLAKIIFALHPSQRRIRSILEDPIARERLVWIIIVIEDELYEELSCEYYINCNDSWYLAQKRAKKAPLKDPKERVAKNSN